MEIGDISKLKYEYFIFILGLFLISSGVWLYTFHFSVSKDIINSKGFDKDKNGSIGKIALDSLILGFAFLLFGFSESSSNYRRDNAITNLNFKIESIVKENQLKNLKEMYGITEKEGIILKIKKWICYRCCQDGHQSITRSSNQSQPPVNPKKKRKF